MTDSQRPTPPPVNVDWLEAVGSALQESSSRFEPFIPKRPHAASEVLQRMTELEALATASLKPPAPEAAAAPIQSEPSRPTEPTPARSEPEKSWVVETRRPRYAPALQDPELVRALLKKAPEVSVSRAASAAQKAAQQLQPSPPAAPQKKAAARIIGEPLPKDPKSTPPRPEDFRPAEVPILQRARNKTPQPR